MTIQQATSSYEQWLGGRLRILPADLKLKHQAMAAGVFPFFRATFYRWMQNWPETCAALQSAPLVLATGDLHVENFGTWRDVEGRLVWGINDFDEAATLPYTLDLVRLAASAHLAIEEAHLCIPERDACEAILKGYRESLAKGGQAFVLAESHEWLRGAVHGVLRDPVRFWAKMAELKTTRAEIPGKARKGLERMLPVEGLEYRVAHRVAGLGSLGRQRFVAIAAFGGGQVAREAKALAPSACAWAFPKSGRKIRYQEVLDSAIRCRDPFVKLKDGWIVRRLAPDCSRVELTQIPKLRDESKLLTAMGWETANVHLGLARAGKAIAKDLGNRPRNWLHEAAAVMVKAVRKDWEQWRK